ncbi:MAG: phosphoglucosamine mutase [Oscillospiraceae bacterium]|nr:phosphoglucosamine mutase [Oscillospiraceae bacterium]
MGRLFGTDGIRGVANKELTAELALNLGKVLYKRQEANNDQEDFEQGLFLIARDTRISGHMLENAVTAGLLATGARVASLGVLPTPAVPYLLKKHKAAAGIMLTASHNPSEYNGIKVFGADGRKLPDALEDEIEWRLLRGILPRCDEVGSLAFWDCREEYVDFLRASSPASLNGLRIGVDCANGAASATAKILFESLGASVHSIGDCPDGYNINDDAGSLHPEKLQKLVVENKLDLGFAFDGDGDRVLAVDEHGKIVDGDKILAICALDRKMRGELLGDTLVATVMSNFGLSVFCRENSIHLRTTKVGDRYVLDELLAGGYSLGGEQSGHIIFTEFSTAGDGQLSALQLLGVVQTQGKPLSELAKVMSSYPQVLKNIPVSQLGKLRLSDDEEIATAQKQAQKILGGDGRVLLRASGTEPLVRVMVEGLDGKLIATIAAELEEVVKRQLL